jgi:hypothetical protein
VRKLTTTLTLSKQTPEFIFFINITLVFTMVRKGGLEPPHLSAPEPKSGASTNSATFAHSFLTAEIIPCYPGSRSHTILFTLLAKDRLTTDPFTI